MSFELTVLGTSSATPTLDRHPSAQFLIFGEHFMLIDCGEGAQVQLMRYGLKSYRIDKIFISHLHPDHFLGLPGLISSLSLKGRKEPLHIFCPKGLREILEVQFLYGEVHLNFTLEYHILESNKEQLIFEGSNLKIFSFPLQHRVPCWGFLFKEVKFPYKIKKELSPGTKPPFEVYPLFRQGKDFTDEKGKTWYFKDYTLANDPPLSYAYITDTLYLPELAESLANYNIDLLYHESTFLSDLQEKALITHHSTAKEAAQFAVLSHAKKLIIGHFSSRYGDLNTLLEEARLIFPETYLGLEGEKFIA